MAAPPVPDHSAVLAAFKAFAMILSVRLQLMLALGGALWLAYMAMQEPSGYRLAILGIYLVGAVGALTFLDITTRKRS